MPQRTTEEAVKTLCPTTLADITGPLRAGSLEVDAVYDTRMDERTELIERYYCAHFVALLDPREVSASSAVGGLSVTYEGRMTTEGMTTYLQTAFVLDETGELARRYKQKERATWEVF